MSNDVKVLANLALSGSLQFTLDSAGFPAEPKLGTIFFKDQCLFAYIKLGQLTTWYPFSRPTLSYLQTEASPKLSWVVTHNLGLPMTSLWFQAQDLGGAVLFGATTAIDNTSFRVTFTEAQAGSIVVVAPESLSVPEIMASRIDVGAVQVTGTGITISGDRVATLSDLNGPSVPEPTWYDVTNNTFWGANQGWWDPDHAKWVTLMPGQIILGPQYDARDSLGNYSRLRFEGSTALGIELHEYSGALILDLGLVQPGEVVDFHAPLSSVGPYRIDFNEPSWSTFDITKIEMSTAGSSASTPTAPVAADSRFPRAGGIILEPGVSWGSLEIPPHESPAMDLSVNRTAVPYGWFAGGEAVNPLYSLGLGDGTPNFSVLQFEESGLYEITVQVKGRIDGGAVKTVESQRFSLSLQGYHTGQSLNSNDTDLDPTSSPTSPRWLNISATTLHSSSPDYPYLSGGVMIQLYNPYDKPLKVYLVSIKVNKLGDQEIYTNGM